MQAQVIHIERKCRLKIKPLFHLGFMTVTISIMDVLQLFLWISFAVAKTQQECVEHDLGIASRLTDDDSLHKSLLFWIYREEKDVLNDLETKFRCYSRHHESCLLSSKHIGWVGPRIFNINLSARNLNGTMPSSLGNLTHLEHLDLSHNNLEGSLPDLSRLTMLKTLNLQNNKLNGILPDWLGQLTGLKVLLIQNNDFSGEIPCQLHYGSKLTLNFSGNPLLRLPKECHIDSFLTWATKTVVFSWELISFILTLILVFLGGIILLRRKNATRNLSTGLFLPEKENVNITKAIAEEVSKDSNVVNDENESSEIQLIYGSHAGANIGDVRENDEILLKDMNVHYDNNMGEESMSMDTIRPSSIQMRHENIQAENETQLDNKIKVECIDMSTKAENELFSRNSYEIEDAQMVLETENGISTTNITEAENIQNMISFSNNIELEDIHMLEESDYQILSSTNVEGVESVTTQDEISSSSSIDVEEIQMPTQEQNEIPSGNNIEIEEIQAQDEISFTKEAAPTWASKEDSSIAKVTIGSKPQAFTTEEIFKVTENFSSKIGEGGFGSVYMGTVEDGQKVAVKVLSAFSNQGKQEFLNELELLCRVNHKYLVSLIGYNSENAELMLIYQYMPGGSLNDQLYGPKSEGKELSWRERLRIALDVAHGLDYLHGGCNTKFIHRDIKTANILLDSKLRGKLADFGLAKGTMDHEVSHITTIVKGTPGYLDPEYFKTQMLTDKSDIYSFGVVLLEILFGRQAVNSKLPPNQVNLVRWAMPYLEMKQQRGLIKAIDKKLIGRFSNIKSIRRVAKVAMACVHEDPSWRPGVGDVIWDLKQAIQDEDKPNTQVTSSYIAMLTVNGVRNLTTFLSSRGKKANIHIDKKGEGADGSMLRKFKIEDINKATQRFSKILGEGGFGKVYKGVMKDGSIIAVKVLSGISHQGLQEFQNEIEHLSHVNHKNLLSLLGYCFSESQNPMLVYEYMSGGSLASHLYDKSTGNGLKWIERVQIALDIAQGLEYLHGGCNTKLIHRDVKTSNILLDDNLRAKLSDFGLSKCFENSYVSHVSTVVKGTIGYIDPKYLIDGKLTEKSDIYSFGVVLLEIICCRKPFMVNAPEETKSLLTYVKDRVRLENPETITGIIDSKLAKTTLNIKSVVCATKLALACVETEKSHRPSATQVVKQLLEVIEVEKSPRYSALDGDAIKRGESANLPTAEEIASSYNGIYEADRIFCRSLNSITEYE